MSDPRPGINTQGAAGPHEATLPGMRACKTVVGTVGQSVRGTWRSVRETPCTDHRRANMQPPEKMPEPRRFG